MNARSEILDRVRLALSDVPADAEPEETVVDWEYGRPAAMDDVSAVFAESVAEYQATVVETDPAGCAAAVAVALAGAHRVIVPDGLQQEWLQSAREAGVEIVDDVGPRSARELDEVDAVVTAAAVGIASTGTIVLDHGPDQGRRALTLVPDLHVCVIGTDQVRSDVPEAVRELRDAVAAGRPLTWISGPSATSDIELNRVEGVHGPRTLYVVLVHT